MAPATKTLSVRCVKIEVERDEAYLGAVSSWPIPKAEAWTPFAVERLADGSVYVWLWVIT